MSKSMSATRRVTMSVALVLVCVLLGALSACGKKEGGGGTVVAEAGPRCAKVATLAKSKGKPTKVAMPKGPVTKLETQDLKPGTGAAAEDGKQLTVNYVGIECNGGVPFDSSWGKKGPNKDDPLEFVLGEGTVIKGWDKGLVGMKVGGLRRLVIPGDLAYGETGKAPSIAANDTLVFVVQLLKVAKAPPPTTTTTAPSTTVAPSTTTTAPKAGSTTTTTSTSTPLTTAVPKTTKP